MKLGKNLLLSPGEACSILEIAAQTGVTELKYGPLTVSFGRPAEVETFRARVPAAEMAVIPNHDKQTEESLRLDEAEMKRDQIAELLITDPMRAEQMIAEGELVEDERSGEYDDTGDDL